MNIAQNWVLAMACVVFTGCSTVKQKSGKSYVAKPMSAMNTVAHNPSVRTTHTVRPSPASSAPIRSQARVPKKKSTFDDEMHTITLDDSWSIRDNAPVLWTEGEVDGNLLRFIVDTGSEMTLLNAEVLRNLGYQPQETGNAILFPFLGGYSDEGRVMLNNFSVGPQALDKRVVYTVDMPRNMPGNDVGGILGMDLLNPMEASVSFPHAKLFFGRPMAEELERSAKQYNFRSVQVQVEDMENNDGQRLWIGGSMNGKPVRYMLDTGSRTSFLSPEVLLRIGGVRIKNMPENDADTLLRLEDHTPVRLKLAGIPLMPSDFCVKRLPELAPVEYDGVIGTEVLMRLDAILSLPSSALYLHDPVLKGVAMVN